VSVLGCPIDALSMTETVERCGELIDAGEASQQVSINAAKLILLRRDARLRRIVQDCALISADGQPVVWASRLLGNPLPERVAGIDLMFALLARAERRGDRVYVLGARADVLAVAMSRLVSRYPGVDFCGWHHGYFTDAESPAIAQEIARQSPDLLLVAMTSPRKEYWLAEYGRDLGVPLMLGVGGSIDVVAGVTRRAPRAWQQLGLEWLFRLLQEPRRMFRRYAVTNARFTYLVGRALVAGRSNGSPQELR
jgi:N-acetylglucosaminyldiphosphoundecaprenol N-acetyl-beta-D-mannosaminyltransferase